MADRSAVVGLLEAGGPPPATVAATAAPAPGQRHAAMWSLGTAVAGQAALLVSGPLVARSLGVQDRGHLALVVLIPLLVTMVCQLGLPNAVTWALAADPEGGRGGLGRAHLRMVLAQLAVATVVHAAVAWAVTRDLPAGVRLVAVASTPTTPAVLAHVYALAVLQGRRRFGAFNLLRTLPALLYALATVALFVTGAGTLASITAAWSLSSVVVGAACVAMALRALGPAAPAERERPPAGLTGFALRGWLGSISPLETFRLDQLVVGLVVSPAALGLYVVGGSFANLPRFVAQSLGAVAFPSVAAEADQAAARRALWRWVAAGTGACAAVVAALAAACPVLVPLLFGQEFRPAVGLTQLLLAGAFLTGVRRVLADGLRGLGQPGAGTVAELATWAALVASLATLVPPFGVTGAAIGFALSAAAGLAVLATSLRPTAQPRRRGQEQPQ
jgi:O-antigen/teichoic acid export membrane protein